MKKRYPIAIAALVLLSLLVWAVLQARPAREVILMRYGVPMANLNKQAQLDSFTSSQERRRMNNRLQASARATEGVAMGIGQG